jgi:serine/threonine protein kinase
VVWLDHENALRYSKVYGSRSTCCISELMLRQILLEQRYGRTVDRSVFGVLTYEMLLGQSPFHGDDEDEIFDAILEDEPLYPITMPRDVVSILPKVECSRALLPILADVILQLLTRDPTLRLRADSEEVRSMPTMFHETAHFTGIRSSPSRQQLSCCTVVREYTRDFFESLVGFTYRGAWRITHGKHRLDEPSARS